MDPKNLNMELDDIDIEDIADFTPEDFKEFKPNPVSKNNLELYYGNLFPFKLFYKWLGLEKTDIFDRREFSFTLENDIYCRFQSYKNDEEFKKEVMRGLPVKIDIGAIYNTQPKYHNSVMVKGDAKSFMPTQKEMVFDIDMTDYDDVRTCCKEANICNKCWKFMVVAYRILQAILVEDFGFANIMWIFSGRRGIHCWVSDERAKKLNNDGRTAIANYIKYRTVNLKTGTKTTLKEPLHPTLERSIAIIDEVFEEYILKGQEILKDAKINEFILMIVKAHFNHKSDYHTLETKIADILKNTKNDSTSKWNSLFKELLLSEKETQKDKNKKGKYTATELCLKEIKLNVMFPRLDINVSKHINHLLKSPFCVHPKTGLISVPLNENDIINFDLQMIPSITDSIDEFQDNKQGKYHHFVSNFEEATKKLLASSN